MGCLFQIRSVHYNNILCSKNYMYIFPKADWNFSLGRRVKQLQSSKDNRYISDLRRLGGEGEDHSAHSKSDQ